MKNLTSTEVYLKNKSGIAAIVFILTVLPFVLWAQEEDSLRLKRYYIEEHKDDLAIKFAITNNTDFFAVNSLSTNYTLYPNTEYKAKLFIAYRFIQFSISYAPNFIPGNNDEEAKGKSDIFSFGTSMELDHWMQRINYDKIQGFYMANPYFGSTEDQKYLVFPDLYYWGITGNTAYRFNPDFSMLALESQTERQLKSAGTLMPILTYRYYVIDDKTELTGTNSSQKSNNFETNLSVGYFYTLVINKSFYASMGMAAGVGEIWTKLLTRTPEGNAITKSHNPIFRGEAMAAIGYNAKRFFAGFQMLATFEKHDQQHTGTYLKHEAVASQIFVGYRFEAPKFLKEKVDMVPFQ